MSELNPITFDWKQAYLEHWDNLPHVRQQNVIYFVTFRLGDSLPATRVAELKERRREWLRLNPPPHTPSQQHDYQRIWTARVEKLLDAGYGSCIFCDADCRGILEASMRHDDTVAYRLGTFVIMPNHVHALVHMLPGHDLSGTVKAWKSVSARRIGKRLGRAGSYWMDEYFDHAVRGDESLEGFVQYIRANPRHLPAGTFTAGYGTLGI